MFGRLRMNPEFVGTFDALAGGLVQDPLPKGKLVAGYRITLRGTHAAAAPINVFTQVGPIIMRSNQGASIISEANFGFITNRTRRLRGGLRWLNIGAAIADPFNLDFIHMFDESGGVHGNCYPAVHGDQIEIVLPAVAAAVVQAGSQWEVQRYVVPEGKAFYLARHHDRGLTIAESRFTFAGHTSSITFQAASVTAPARISIFDASEVRRGFWTWPGLLSDTNAFGAYDQNEADQGVFSVLSDDPTSVTDALSIDKLTVELQGGAGVMRVSHCVIEPMPAAYRQLADRESLRNRVSQLSSLNNLGGQSGIEVAYALQSAARSSSILIDEATAEGQIPITPNKQAMTVMPRTAAARITAAIASGR